MNSKELYTLGIDIGSTTVKIAILDNENEVLFSDYERHFANIQETLSDLLGRAIYKLGPIQVSPVITGSGGLTLAKHLGVPFVQEVIAVSTALQDYAPQTDVAIELGGEDAKIIYFEGGNVEQRMNGVCAGGTGSTMVLPEKTLLHPFSRRLSTRRSADLPAENRSVDMSLSWADRFISFQN